MDSDLIILVVQIIAALGVVVSVVYLGVQIHQQNEITKAQFGHSLTQRQYERYFATARDGEFADFLSKDWSINSIIVSGSLSPLNNSKNILNVFSKSSLL